MEKVKVKQLRDVTCPNCEGVGKIDVGVDFGTFYEKCDRCNGTGELEVEIEHCKKCGEELPWNDMDFGFDEKTETVFRCLANKCDRALKSANI